MIVSRRNALLSTLFGAGYVGLRALATGLPVSLLLNPRRALAGGAATCGATKAQFIIMSTSGSGDPINANVPGTYEDKSISHSTDPLMNPTSMTIGGQSYMAAAPWASLPANVLSRTCFWHIMTNTPVHPKETDVLRLMGATNQGEMLASLLAKQLAPCLGTIQTQPISLGAASPSEGLTFGGQALPIIPALALKATLTSPAGPLTNLQSLRDSSLNDLYGIYKNAATPAQQAYIDSLVTTQQQVRNINQSLLDALTSIKDNTAPSQALAAVSLIQMKVTPVVAIHIPFGGDNHRDIALANETAQTVSGVQTIVNLMAMLQSAGLSDQVTFMTLNVFGRTINATNTDGRNHNGNLQASVTIGKPFKSAVIGGVTTVGSDYGAMPINSKTGQGSMSGDIPAVQTLASFGQTMMAAVGVDPSVISSQIMSGQIIQPALA
jgi:hypothetical protein